MYQNNEKTNMETRDDVSVNRTPPGQKLTEKFPVLTYGDIPKIPLTEWSFTIDGLVNNKITFNWEEIMSFKQTILTKDFHCVTQWSRLDNLWEGIRVKDLIGKNNLKLSRSISKRRESSIEQYLKPISPIPKHNYKVYLESIKKK